MCLQQKKTILSLMEFEIVDLLHFELGKLCSNIT